MCKIIGFMAITSMDPNIPNIFSLKSIFALILLKFLKIFLQT